MATNSFVKVDYEKLDALIKQRGTSRAKVAAACGILSGTLGNSFTRKSRMKAEYVKKIADFLSVSPLILLEKDENGNITGGYSDWSAVISKDGTSDTDKDLEKSIRDSFADLCEDLNWDGSEKLYTVSRLVSDLIKQIPKYRKDSDQYEAEKSGKETEKEW